MEFTSNNQIFIAQNEITTFAYMQFSSQKSIFHYANLTCNQFSSRKTNFSLVRRNFPQKTFVLIKNTVVTLTYM